MTVLLLLHWSSEYLKVVEIEIGIISNRSCLFDLIFQKTIENSVRTQQNN